MSRIDEIVDRHLNEGIASDILAFAKKFGVDLKDDIVKASKEFIGKKAANKEIGELLKQGYKEDRRGKGWDGSQLVILKKDKDTKAVYIPS